MPIARNSRSPVVGFVVALGIAASASWALAAPAAPGPGRASSAPGAPSSASPATTREPLKPPPGSARARDGGVEPRDGGVGPHDGGSTGTPGGRGDQLDRYRKWAKDWRARRDIHRKARLKRLRYRLDRTLHGQPIPAEIRAELEAHARRMAQLNRIKEVAVDKGDDQTIHRADALIRRETTRHDRWMNERKGGRAGRDEAPAGGASP